MKLSSLYRPLAQTFPRLRLPGSKQKQQVVRRHHRHACRVKSSLSLIEPGLDIEGLLIDVSEGGALFRPPTTYLLDRKGAHVRIMVHQMGVGGQIVGTSPRGYHIKFFQMVESEQVELMRLPARVQDASEEQEETSAERFVEEENAVSQNASAPPSQTGSE